MKQQTPYQYSIKILLIGNSGSGKSSIIMRYIDNKFAHSFYSTIGVDYVSIQIYHQKTKILEINDTKIKMQIWDTAGQDRFKNITSSYYRGADGILILFDITDRVSYEGIQNWLSQIEKYADQNIQKIVIGNKCDLSERRVIPASQANNYAKNIGIPYIETSARDGTNVQAVFMQMARKIMNNRIRKSVSKDKNLPQKLSARDNSRPQDSGCC